MKTVIILFTVIRIWENWCLICELQKIALILLVIWDQLTRELTGFFICELQMKSVIILFTAIGRWVNWCLICELQNIALILLGICDQLTEVLVFFFCDQLRGALVSSFVIS
jgi:hypothetical protein